MGIRLVVACYLSLVATKVSALEFAEPEEEPVTATLITEHASIQPGGSTRIGVLFEIEDGWHIYAQDPGEAGLPTKVEWTTPQGVVAGDLMWPTHHEFLDPGDIHTLGYEKSVLLTSGLEVQEGYAQAQIPIHANVTWLACKDICIPGKTTLELVLPLRPNPPVLSPHAHLFQEGA
jgi:thiol:disulfide interchange protein DsbD